MKRLSANAKKGMKKREKSGPKITWTCCSSASSRHLPPNTIPDGHDAQEQ